MATQFKRYGRGGRFKNPAIGDAGISALRQRDQTIIDSLQLSRNQQAEIDTDQMSAMERAFSKEEQNIQDLQALEDKIYSNRRDNIKLRASREVQALQGQADEYGRQAEHWKQLTPKLSKALSGLAEGYGAVANRMGYDQALKNQADNDTLSIWNTYNQGMEEGIQLAHEQNLSDQRELKEQGATDSQILALDSTSAFYRSGRVHYLTKDLIDNIDTHIQEGMAAYTRQFGKPQSQSELNKAYKWIQNTIERSVGVSNYKYHGGVKKFRDEFNKKAAGKSKQFASDRNHRISTSLYNEHKQIFEAQPEKSQVNFDNLLNHIELHLKDNNGDAVAKTKGDAIKYLFSDWAKDLSIDIKVLKERFKLLTPEKGRQYGDAGNGFNKSEVGGRYPQFFKEVINERNDAIKAQNTKLKNAETALNWANDGKAKEFLSTWDGTPSLLDQEIQKYDLLGPQGAKAKERLQSTKRNSGKALAVQNVKSTLDDLIFGQKWVEAYQYLDGQSSITGDDRAAYITAIEPLRELEGTTGYKEKDIDNHIKGVLEGLLDKSFNNNRTRAEVEEKLTEAKSLFLSLYLGYRDQFKTQPNGIAKAAKAARTELDKLMKSGKDDESSIFHVTRAGKNPLSNDAVFTSSLKPIDPADQIDFKQTQLLNSNFSLPTLLNIKDGRKVVSIRQREDWIEAVNAGGPLEPNNLVLAINDSLPNNHELKDNIQGQIRQLLLNSGDERAIKAAKLIPPDNNESVAGLVDDPNVLRGSRSNTDLIKRISLIKYIEQNGSPPVRPEVLSPITEALIPLNKQELENKIDEYRKQGWTWDPFSKQMMQRRFSY